MTFKLSGRARDMNTTPKYTPVERAPKTYDDGNDFSLESRAGKRKFDQTKTPAKGAVDDESGVKDEPLNETAEEVQTSPKKKSKKRLIEEVKEEEAEVANNEEEEEKPEVEAEEVVQPVVSEKKKKKKKSLVKRRSLRFRAKLQLCKKKPLQPPQRRKRSVRVQQSKRKLHHPKNPSLRKQQRQRAKCQPRRRNANRSLSE